MDVVCGIVNVGRQPFAYLILSREHDDDSSAGLIASVLGCYLTTTTQPLKGYHRKLQRYDTQTPTHFHAWDLLRAFTQSHASELHFTTPVTQQPLAQRHCSILRATRLLAAPRTHISILTKCLQLSDLTTHLN